jgi:uncharacterized membrane protein
MTNTSLRRREPASEISHHGRTVSVPALVDSWVAEGIISPAQGDEIKARSEEVPVTAVSTDRRAQRASLAIEALGYLGGAIVLVGTMSLVAQLWDEISTAVRLALVCAAAVGLLASGFAVPTRLRDVGTRLTAVLWLAATAATFGFLRVLGSEVMDLAGQDLVLLTSCGTSLVAVALWSIRPTPLQQVAMMTTLMLTAAAAIADFVSADSLPGLGVWSVGAVWAGLGWMRLLSPRRLALTAGAVATVVGASMTSAEDAGTVLALATTAGILVAAVVMRDLVLLAVGAVAALLVLPAAVSRWFPDTLAAPVALLVVGAGLVCAAIWTAHRGLTADRDAWQRHQPGTPSVRHSVPQQRRQELSGKSPVVSGAGVMTLVAAVTAAAAAAVGLAAESAYDASAATTQMLRGYDLVTLVLVVPLLTASRPWTERLLLLRSGLLAYLVYSYLFAAMTGGLGVAFLVDVVVASASTFALVLTLAGLNASPPERPGSGARVSAVVLGVLALSLGAMWLTAAVHAAATGEVPQGSALVESDLTVRLGIMLDLWLLVPLYALSAVLLWRHLSWGRVLGLLAVISGLLHQLSYLCALAFQAGAEVPGARAFDPFEPIIVIGYLVALVPMIKPRSATAP